MDAVQVGLLKTFRPQFLKREQECEAFAGGEYTLDVYRLGAGELLVLTLRRENRQLILSALKLGGVALAVESSPEPAA